MVNSSTKETASNTTLYDHYRHCLKINHPELGEDEIAERAEAFMNDRLSVGIFTGIEQVEREIMKTDPDFKRWYERYYDEDLQ
jgi:hypothetical protein